MGARRLGFHAGNWISAALWAPLMLAPASIGLALSEQLESASPQFRSILTIALVVGIVVLIRSLRK
jgi:membrane protein DedA with SNARE-associated domain